MNIYKLACEKRGSNSKAKAVRKKGFVPAVFYGPNIDSLSIKISKIEADKFLRTHSVGAQVILEIEGEEHRGLLRNYQTDPLSRETLHIDFYALTASEKVRVALPINYLNSDSISIEEFLQEQLSELEISTLPEFLLEHIDVDISKYSLGDVVFVRDLDVFNDENIEVLTHADSVVCSITHAITIEEEPEEEEVEREVEVIGEEESEQAEED